MERLEGDEAGYKEYTYAMIIFYSTDKCLQSSLKSSAKENIQ